MNILLAEDEQEIAVPLKKNLMEDGHYVLIAQDGIEALNAAGSMEFDIYILDWRMPMLTGLEVCKKLREQNIKKPIILLTALSKITNKVEALDSGADDYITKPFAYEELKARINAVQRRYLNNDSIIELDDIKLDLVKRKAEYFQKEIKLSEKEFSLLHFFLLNKSRIVSKDEILKNVWGTDLSGSSNFLESTIKNLRKKLEECTGKKLIKSCYGEGYIFL